MIQGVRNRRFSRVLGLVGEPNLKLPTICVLQSQVSAERTVTAQRKENTEKKRGPARVIPRVKGVVPDGEIHDVGAETRKTCDVRTVQSKILILIGAKDALAKRQRFIQLQIDRFRLLTVRST